MTNKDAVPAPRPRNRLRPFIWGAIAALELLPLIAMQFTKEVNWTVSDFVIFGAMLTAAGGGYELATRVTGNGAYRAGFGLAVVASFLMVWANLAVGIIGNEDNDINMVFFGVLAVWVIGAFVVGFKPIGMARVMIATAVAQILAAVAIMIAGYGATPIFTAIYCGIWLGSSLLFRKSARDLGAQ